MTKLRPPDCENGYLSYTGWDIQGRCPHCHPHSGNEKFLNNVKYCSTIFKEQNKQPDVVITSDVSPRWRVCAIASSILFIGSLLLILGGL